MKHLKKFNEDFINEDNSSDKEKAKKLDRKFNKLGKKWTGSVPLSKKEATMKSKKDPKKDTKKA